MAITKTAKKNGNLFRVLAKINRYCESNRKDFPNYQLSFSTCYPMSFFKPEISIHIENGIVDKEEMLELIKYAENVCIVGNRVIVTLEMGEMA